MTKIEILEKAKEMACHNLFCYSKNYAMTVPKEGYEKDWQETKDEAKILESMIGEIENPPTVEMTIGQLEKAIMKMKEQRQYRDMSSVLKASVRTNPNGRHYLEFEQLTPQLGCDSHRERIEL